MKKNSAFPFFTFGLFLVAIGIITSFFDWKQSNILMAIGLIFELLAGLIYSWNKIKNNKNDKKDK